MKRSVVLAIVAVMLLSALFISVKVFDEYKPHGYMTSSAEPDTMKIIIVPYFDPHDMQWNTIYAVADKYPGTMEYAIINPCSGPCGNALSNEWQNVITNLKSRGIKTLGYVFNTSESIENIDYYLKSPVRTDGIFFDNESSTDNLENFKQYSDHVHRLGGIVYINPGYDFPQVDEYLSSGNADVANIHEMESDKTHHIMINSKLPPTRLSVILGNVTTSNVMASKMDEVASKGIGIMYVYGNSYHELPSFFADEVKQASLTRVKG